MDFGADYLRTSLTFEMKPQRIHHTAPGQLLINTAPNVDYINYGFIQHIASKKSPRCAKIIKDK